MKVETRSPIKDKPLRLPGQSLSAERRDLIEDHVASPLMLALFMVLLAIYESYGYYFDVPRKPLMLFVGVGLTFVYAAIRMWRIRPRLKRLRQAIEGERVVGEFLERLRTDGYHVFHDLQGENFNLDHVIVGPAGIFNIETKTWSKPEARNAVIRFDGEQIKIGSLEPSRDPVVQAKAQAHWLRSLINESTGRAFDVRPVIVFPGWFVENINRSFNQIWVLEPKALPTFLRNEPDRLSFEEVNLVKFHLSRAVRSAERRRADLQ